VKDIDTIIDKVVVVENGVIAFESEVAEIGRNYLFETVADFNGIKEILYQEKSPMGYRIIRSSKGNTETTLDLELLFNAIINNKIKTKKI
jgi:ABC-2 type transport system ATP-binding protein